MIRGIDVSHHNIDDAHSPIDWQKVAAITAPDTPVQFAIIKLTEGADLKDATAAANARGARAAGIQFGYYHYARPGSNAAADEAKNFYEGFAGIGVAPTLTYPFALDLEENKGLTPAEYLIWVEDFLQTFLAYFDGTEPVILIYGSVDFLKTNLPADHRLGGRYPLWIAAPAAHSPALPPGWTDWAVWQYDWHAVVAGVGVEVDADWIK